MMKPVSRYGLIALLLLAAASLLADLYVRSQVYYPVVRISSPDGVDIAAVLAETNERLACGATNDRFLEPLKKRCKECKIVAARCERELEGVDLALRLGQPLPYPTVVAKEARVAFMGPPALAALGCAAAAATVVANGLKKAACLPPQNVPAPKS